MKSSSISKYYKIFYSIFFLFALTNCSVTKYLEEDQYLLYKQTIKGNKKIGKDEILSLFREVPNRKIFGTRPYLYAYYVGRTKLDTAKLNNQREEIITEYREKIDKIDTSITGKQKKKRIKKIGKLRDKRDKKIDKVDLKLKEGNWLMRVVGEPPSIFDTAQTNYNVRQATFYLNSKGYFLNNVEVIIDTNGRDVFETYNIVENQPYRLRDIKYVIEDPIIDSIVKNNLQNAEIKAGKRYQEANISAERDRINNLLKHTGYYDFNTQYILVEIDSTIGDMNMDVRYIVHNPPNKSRHPRYLIDEVIFNTQVSGMKERETSLDTVKYEGITYIYKKDNFSKKILNKKIKLHKGDFYDQTSIQQTQRRLAALDMYKFININFEKIEADTINDTIPQKLVAHIRTNNLPKFQMTEEGGVNVSSVGFIPGPFGSLNFKSRNTFRGFELFEATLRASVMGQAALTDPTKAYRTEEYNGEIALSFPQFFFPTRLRFIMEEYAPRTRFSLGYNRVVRPEYNRNNLRSAMNYIFNTNPFVQYNISIVDLNLINTDYGNKGIEGDSFRVYLNRLAQSGNNLRTSFGRSFVSSINGTFTYNNNLSGGNIKSRFVKVFLESGGTTMNLVKNSPALERALNSPEMSDTIRIFGEQLKTFRFFKINTDFRFYIPVNKSTFAMRFNLGYAYAYDFSKVLPYEKYFFMGGSNSMRAWLPRRLGPGTFTQTSTRFIPEQPGEIMFEMNYEYRFNMIGFFDGAFFVDAGNLWMARKEKGQDGIPGREGVEFDITKAWKQLAVGTGFGLRLNFSFLILRLDLAVKTFAPRPNRGSEFVLFTPRGLQEPRLNIGIGYPF